MSLCPAAVADTCCDFTTGAIAATPLGAAAVEAARLGAAEVEVEVFTCLDRALT